MPPNPLDLDKAITNVENSRKTIWAIGVMKDRYRLIIYNPTKAQKNAEHRNLQKEKESDEKTKLLEEKVKYLEV